MLALDDMTLRRRRDYLLNPLVSPEAHLTMFNYVPPRGVPFTLPELYRILDRRIKLERDAERSPPSTPNPPPTPRTSATSTEVQTEVNLVSPVAPQGTEIPRAFLSTLRDTKEALRKSHLARDTLKESLTAATKHIDDLQKKQAVPTYTFKQKPTTKPPTTRVPVVINDMLAPGTKRKERSDPRYFDRNVVQEDKKQMVARAAHGTKRKERPDPRYFDRNVVQDDKKQMVPILTTA